MNLLSFLQKKFKLTENNVQLIRLIEKNASGNFFYKNEYIVKKARNAYLREVIIQKEIADTTSVPMPGGGELLDSLSKISSNEIVFMRFIDSEDWDGRIYFKEDNFFIGLIVGKKKNIGWKTPPNWDGSEEMLRQYNSKTSPLLRG